MAETKLTSGVLERIHRQISCYASESEARGEKRGDGILVLFCGALDILKQKTSRRVEFQFESLKSRLAGSSRPALGFSFMAEKILNTERIIQTLNPSEVFHEEDFFRSELVVEKYSVLLCPNITVNTLSRVALGTVDSFVSHLIWTWLALGRRVEIDFASARRHSGADIKASEMRRLVEQRIETLLKMGATELRGAKEFAPARSVPAYESSAADAVRSVAESGVHARNLVTEKDILSLARGGARLVLQKGAIVTPLAWDRARELGITLVFEEPRALP